MSGERFDLLSRRRRSVAAGLLAASLVSMTIGCSGADGSEVAGSASESGQRDTGLAQAPTRTLAAFDLAVPFSMVEGFWPTYEDARSLMEASDSVFVGRLVAYVEGVLHLESDPADDPDPTVEVYDGLVFEVQESIKGEPDSRIIVAVPALVTEVDGTPRLRIRQAPFSVVEKSIAPSGEVAPASYLVHGVRDDRYDDVIFFTAPAGLVEVQDNGTIVAGLAQPFAPGTSVDLEEVRAAASDEGRS